MVQSLIFSPSKPQGLFFMQKSPRNVALIMFQTITPTTMLTEISPILRGKYVAIKSNEITTKTPIENNIEFIE